MGQDKSDRPEGPGPAPEFDDFYLHEYPAVGGLLQGLLRSRLVAEELAQETFLVAYRDWGRVSGLDNPRAWVRRVALNQRASFLGAYSPRTTTRTTASARSPTPWAGRLAPSRPSSTRAAAGSPGGSAPGPTAGGRHELQRPAADNRQDPGRAAAGGRQRAPGGQRRPGRRRDRPPGDPPRCPRGRRRPGPATWRPAKGTGRPRRAAPWPAGEAAAPAAPAR